MNSYSSTHLTDQIIFKMDETNYTGMVLIDLQKVLHTVHHDILLHKLKTLGCKRALQQYVFYTTFYLRWTRATPRASEQLFLYHVLD